MSQAMQSCIAVSSSPFLSLFQDENSVVAGGSLLTHSEL